MVSVVHFRHGVPSEPEDPTCDTRRLTLFRRTWPLRSRFSSRTIALWSFRFSPPAGRFVAGPNGNQSDESNRPLYGRVGGARRAEFRGAGHDARAVRRRQRRQPAGQPPVLRGRPVRDDAERRRELLRGHFFDWTPPPVPSPRSRRSTSRTGRTRTPASSPMRRGTSTVPPAPAARIAWAPSSRFRPAPVPSRRSPRSPDRTGESAEPPGR